MFHSEAIGQTGPSMRDLSIAGLVHNGLCDPRPNGMCAIGHHERDSVACTEAAAILHDVGVQRYFGHTRSGGGLGIDWLNRACPCSERCDRGSGRTGPKLRKLRREAVTGCGMAQRDSFGGRPCAVQGLTPCPPLCQTMNKLESLALKHDFITNVEVSIGEITDKDEIGPTVVKEAEALGMPTGPPCGALLAVAQCSVAVCGAVCLKPNASADLRGPCVEYVCP